ncbi:hypothetical protein F896_02117 [Acinetobacter genomosp. 15BJ]|uniref:Uncharacterized protein n=1 Tax=Acinetobacter genomosp. 15BJ TaxID=106651 RepID=R9AZT1_9GAMM|nr:hypothetical protein F896_02117 [Acinetobacter genomosp. 15BJ]
MPDIEIETHPLQPFLSSSAKLLMLGSFPPPQSRWKMDFYYPNDMIYNEYNILIYINYTYKYTQFLTWKCNL